MEGAPGSRRGLTRRVCQGAVVVAAPFHLVILMKLTVLGTEQMAASRRKMRSPMHQFNLSWRPWQIQPFMLAPVLPGETMKSLLLQNRCVTAPISNALIGWWLEHYIFYVKLRDLYARDKFTDMLLKPEADLSSLDSATDVGYYHQNQAGLAINWAQLCTEVIVDSYFRHEGEVAGDYTLNGMYTANVNMTNALDSAINATALEGAANVDQNLVSATPGQGDATTAVYTSEIAKAMREWEFARMNKVTDMTFEDWCAQFGVVMPQEELFTPELVRYSKEWTYPTNTIDPTSGAARSACSWAVQMKADKDRYFKEPGFLVGIAVVRPKVYFKNLDTNFAMLMKDAYSWLPPSLAADPYSSFVKVAAGDPPLDANSAAYYVDIKDLFIYGDQFVNYDLSTATGKNLVVLPNAALTNKRYPASTDADNLFVDTTAGVGKVACDGVVQLHILGRQVETSPEFSGNNKSV